MFMTASTASGRTTTAKTFGFLSTLYAVTFFLGALLHLGVRIPLGFTVLAEPRILPATIVEGLAGLVLAVSAYAIFARRTWAWLAATAAHGFALAGVLLGIGALALGGGTSTTLNNTYHLVMVVVLVAGLIFLSRPTAKRALDRNSRASTST